MILLEDRALKCTSLVLNHLFFDYVFCLTKLYLKHYSFSYAIEVQAISFNNPIYAINYFTIISTNRIIFVIFILNNHPIIKIVIFKVVRLIKSDIFHPMSGFRFHDFQIFYIFYRLITNHRNIYR